MKNLRTESRTPSRDLHTIDDPPGLRVIHDCTRAMDVCEREMSQGGYRKGKKQVAHTHSCCYRVHFFPASQYGHA